MWCLREVELFSELHGKDKILALLIDGEPDEAFPPSIREREVDGNIILVEPLAADIRADSWAKSLKLLRQEKLRLIAPILGVKYDDLKQRHKERFVKKVATLSSAAFACVTAFAVYATVQNIRINYELQQKLRNESYVLSEYSERELDNGAPDVAMKLALAALPENLNKPERPYVADAEKALVDASGWYDVVSGYKPYKTVELSASPSNIDISPSGKYTALRCMTTQRVQRLTKLKVSSIRRLM
jgi:hypothetical protein